MKRVIRKLLPRRLIDFMLSLLWLCEIIGKKKRRQQPPTFLLQTPVHSNFGDHAIAYAELRLLSKCHPIEITDYQLNILLKFPRIFKKIIGDGRILITGGGNLGTLWITIEQNIRKVLALFPENQIIILPQSAYYEDSDYGREELEKAKRIYNACSDLTIMAREQTSYRFLKQHFNNVRVFPDMVLSLSPISFDCERSGLLLMLRNDGERAINDGFDIALKDALTLTGLAVSKSDMIAPEKKIPVTRREELLIEKFRQFASAELVVTDRLHAMIFSVITGTPCAVLPCKSPKIKGIYDWLLSDCEYVCYTETPDDIIPFWNSVKNKKFSYNNAEIAPYFRQLAELFERN